MRGRRPSWTPPPRAGALPAPAQTPTPPQQTGTAQAQPPQTGTGQPQPPQTGTAPARTRRFGWGTVTAVVALALAIGGLAAAWFAGAFTALATRASIVSDWTSAFLARTQGTVRRTVPSGLAIGDIQLDAWLPAITTGFVVVLAALLLLLLLRSIWRRAVRRASARAAAPATPGTAPATPRGHGFLWWRWFLARPVMIFALALAIGLGWQTHTWDLPADWLMRASTPNAQQLGMWVKEKWLWLIMSGGLLFLAARFVSDDPKVKDAAGFSIVGLFVLILIVIPIAWYVDSQEVPSSASATRPPPGHHTLRVPALGSSDEIRIPPGKKPDILNRPGGVRIHVLFTDGRGCIAWETCEKIGPGRYKPEPLRAFYAENLERQPATVRYRFIPGD